ncbi:MAG: bifunctional [glutamate--ammonia ligase]-adenylyl-L-tyrosine phosphorylase/[glutamate--ammonia-ligase] adenylyltransferase [Isosphaeraceae bacterium]
MPDFPSSMALLDDAEAARRWLRGLGVRDVDRGLRDLRDLARGDRPTHLVAALLRLVEHALPGCPDPGMALTNLERYLAACPEPDASLALLVLDPRTVEILLQLFSGSQYLSEQMIGEPGLIFWLRSGPERRTRERLIADLWSDLERETNDDGRKLAIRRFRHREMLRIGYNDIIRGHSIEVITADLSSLAEACVDVAYRLARVATSEKHGEPLRADGALARFVVLALGKLGGQELNYSSDIDLVFLHEGDGPTAGRKPISAGEFFARMAGDLVRLLADFTTLGAAYRVDLRLRPEGNQGALTRSLESALGYYETQGRTWERQALIKCRPVAGDLDLGRSFLDAIAPFVYRRYLGAAEIGEIKALKRKIEARTVSAGTNALEVKTGRGGIRDVEFVVQFLQLLHGGPYPSVRHPNTLHAIARLEQVGCLSAEERGVMEDTYKFLRGVEHRLQAMFDLQTHQMPSDPEGQRMLAIRLGYPPLSPWEDRCGPAQRFLADYNSKTELNRRILNHLLHDAFLDDAGAPRDPVVDLILDPEPSPELVDAALGRHKFRDPPTAYRNLMTLAREETPFLSQARCRHFCAAIAPRLLEALDATSDPDMALNNLEKVSASLGAKAMLWELFSFNPPTLRLYVELCATSQFLSEILINNPGMIDDLMDSLVVDRAQPASAIRGELSELCRGAEDLGPILLGFRNKELIRIGTRDILQREPIRDVTRELSDVAEAIVDQVARDQLRQATARYGRPRRSGDGGPARSAIVALGRLGGRELSYHSDLDLTFLHEAEGQTEPPPTASSISLDQFYSGVAQRVLRALQEGGGHGPLYSADARLRPLGGSGPLTITLGAFRDYHRGIARAWERMALTRARVIHSRGDFGRDVSATIREILIEPIDTPTLAEQVLGMRRKLEETAHPHGFRRGRGGLVDIEFLVQYLQLANAAVFPEILKTNVWEALDALKRAGLIDPKTHADLRAAYNFFRTVEARLRIVHNRASVEIPRELEPLARLASRLGYDPSDPGNAVTMIEADVRKHSARTRELFERYVGPV